MDALLAAAIAGLALTVGYFMGRTDEWRANERQRMDGMTRMDRIRDKRF